MKGRGRGEEKEREVHTTIKSLSHIPFCARIEEGEFLACFKTLWTGEDAERGCVEDLCGSY